LKDGNLYICKVPLTLKHLYTLPSERTVDELFGSWRVASKNMTTKMVVLAQSNDDNTRMRITLDMLDNLFDIVQEELREESKNCVVCMYHMDGVIENGLYCGLIDDEVNTDAYCGLYEPVNA
jgi:hypothetical protein